jgi:hypothetical protein
LVTSICQAISRPSAGLQACLNVETFSPLEFKRSHKPEMSREDRATCSICAYRSVVPLAKAYPELIDR